MSKSLNTSIVVALALLAACRSVAPAGGARSSPYPASRSIDGVSWDFSGLAATRRAIGSDLWPCAWARDGNLYCAWGDGGGFDGNADNVGRASLGIARIVGSPDAHGSLEYSGKNVWGTLPYAEHPATFGGKIVSMISVDGTLYAIGSLWTAANSSEPLRTGESGPLHTLVWSSDLGAHWTIAPWSTPSSLGTFLNFGRDNAGAPDEYVYLYYTRPGEDTRLYLKRVPKGGLTRDPATPGLYQYLSGADARGRARGWSVRESDAAPVFVDGNRVNAPDVVYDPKLRRFLLTAGHYAPGQEESASIGRVGLFEGTHPWGPWSAVGYYDDWGALGPTSGGDFLGLHLSMKWASADGKTLWGVFSGLNEFDSFNVVKARLHARWWLGLP
jgi:hypothetical protein